MKKVISIFIVLLMIFTVSCSKKEKKTEAAENCETKISNIGEVSLSKGDLITDAETAFFFLTVGQQELVENADELVAARERYDLMVKLDATVTEMVASFTNVFVPQYYIVFADMKENIDFIDSSYVVLTDAQKQEIKDYDTYVEKKASYMSLASEINQSAAVYVEAFLEINKGKNITITEIGCLAQEKNGVRYYYFAINYSESEENKAVYSTARFSNVPTVDVIVSKADVFFCETAATENTDALACGNYPIDVEAVLAIVNK